jgi:hypothetical protein
MKEDHEVPEPLLKTRAAKILRFELRLRQLSQTEGDEKKNAGEEALRLEREALTH